MKKTIIYFTGVYDTLDLFTDKLREAFASMGYSSFVYDARMQQQSKDALLALLDDAAKKETGSPKGVSTVSVEDPGDMSGQSVLPLAPSGQSVQSLAPSGQPSLPAASPAQILLSAAPSGQPCGLSRRFACVTFNNLGYNLDLPDGRNLWEAYGIPYINILMDHPFHYEKPLRRAPGTAIVLCTDRNHVKYIRRYFGNIRQVDFLPHAGVELGSRHKPLSERSIDVLYAGALPIYTVGKMIPDLSSIPEVDGEEMAQEVLGELVRHPGKTTEEVIEDYLKFRRNDISEKRVQEIIVQMRFVDSYATSFFREQAVRILVENGIRVTAYGTGWNQCEWSGNPYLVYGGKVLAPQILPLMNDSKIVLNTMTWFKAGAHDRIFNGMLAKAAVVTDDSTYLRREFTDGKELSMFSLKELGALPERVFGLFGHLDAAQEMADRGYRAAKENHTWKSRAEYIRECFL